jgi:hypothetical protein
MKDKEVAKVEKSRRKFLKSATKVAVYTPPAMVIMSKPGLANFAESGGTYPRSPLQGDLRSPDNQKRSKKKMRRRRYR